MDRPEEHSGLRDEVSPIKSPNSVSPSYRAITRLKSGGVSSSNEIHRAQLLFHTGNYVGALEICERIYEFEAYRTENLLLLGAIHFQLHSFSESIFFSQQAIRVDPNCGEAYSNMGNSFKELGDTNAAIQFYLQAVRLKPRFPDAYNNLACCYLQQGLVADAVDTFQMAILLDPLLIDAHSNLGALFKSQGNFEAAKKCYFESIRLKSDFSIGWNNLAGVFKEEGENETAITYYQEAIRLVPIFADAHSNLGNSFRELKRFDEAIVSYKEAIRLRPEFAIAYGNLGACYLDMHNSAEAMRCLRYAIQLDPRCADFFNNLGNAIKASSNTQQTIEEAVQCYRSALRLQPNYPHAYNNLGCALREVNMIKEALHCFVTAARLLPSFAEAHCNIGTTMTEHALYPQAVGHFEEALRLAPTSPYAHLSMGNVMKEMGDLEDALKWYKKALSLDELCAEAHSNIGVVLSDMGLLQEALESFNQALKVDRDNPSILANYINLKSALCSWDDREYDLSRLLDMLRYQLMDDRGQLQLSTTRGGSFSDRSGNYWRSAQFASKVTLPALQPYHALRYPLSPLELLQLSKKYAIKAKSLSQMFIKDFRHKTRAKAGKIKIGYVSSNFNDHPLTHLMSSVFGMHDTAKFEVVCYALTASDGSRWRIKLEDEFVFKDLSELHFSDAAVVINNDDVNILIDLNGYTYGNKNEIFALRPCPIQISLLGYSGTTGADYFDYLVTDHIISPLETRAAYYEKLIYLPHCYIVNNHKHSHRYILDDNVDKSTFPTRAQYGISDDKFVFCNFGQSYKINPEIFSVWMNILKAVPNSVLWLVRSPGECGPNLLKEARQRGVRADQIVLSDGATIEEHIKRGILADLCLDTSCSNSQSTACDILWAGTPLLTLQGQTSAARSAASMLHAVGLSELICTHLIGKYTYSQYPCCMHLLDKMPMGCLEYEEAAVALAQDANRLFTMRRHLEASRDSCALFDTRRWVRNLERGLHQAWRAVEQKQPFIDISPEDQDPVFTLQDVASFM